jgi:thiamine pyrophosphokinase
VRHPEEQDATDSSLALDLAMTMSPRRILVLASPAVASTTCCPPRSFSHRSDTRAPRSTRSWARHASTSFAASGAGGEPGELVTLLAVNGPAEGVTTEGLAYPLRGETLEPGSSRGVSNVFAVDRARVTVERGVVLAVRPGSSQEPP